MEDPQYESVILDDTAYEEEAILPKQRRQELYLPPQLAKARNLEQGNFWESRQETFLKQGRLLADYEDDYPYSGDPVRYYPTYQSLTDEELRGYFAWRAKIRARQVVQAPVTFIFLYIYELINLIGEQSAEEAYEQLLFVKRKYASFGWNIDSHLNGWLRDFVIYYNLDPALISDSAESLYNKYISVLQNLKTEKQANVLDAVKQLAPKWLGRSRFYASHFAEMDEVIYKVLQGMDEHYAKKCTRSLMDQLFGTLKPRHVHIFSQAIFANPLMRRNYQYTVDNHCVYKCENGIWTANWRPVGPHSGRKLEKLLKTIDQIMREEFGFGHPVKGELSTAWVVRLIRQTARELVERKAAAEKNRIKIDFSKLNKIRSDAAIIQEKLVTEEDEADDFAFPQPGPDAGAVSEDNASIQLTGQEKRLLKCLLYGEATDWLKSEGQMLSVLADSINYKLYDMFGDTVLDEEALPVNDYIDELKELVSQ